MNISITIVENCTIYLDLIPFFSFQDADTSDFEEVVNSIYFVDKTLLIEDLLSELHIMERSTKSRFVKVLSRNKFGKSTNLKMIKMFLGITVDENGTPSNANKSNNFHIFSNNSLEIFKRKTFFDIYFGAYPVISINCKALCGVTSFDDLLCGLRKIVTATFNEHKYLLRTESLWVQHFHKESFEVFFDEKQTKQMHEYTIYCSFSILSKILHSHFKKLVVILIDDFDSFQESPAWIDNSLKVERKKITNFMGILYSDILLSNKHLFGALLSGSLHLGKLHLKKVSRSEKPYTDIPDISENRNNSLWKYYGLSYDELRLLLGRVIHDPELVREAEDTILTDFSVKRNNINSVNSGQPCSVWSVMQYFDQKRKYK